MKTIKGTRKQLEKQASKILEKEIKRLLKKQPSIIIGLIGGTSISGIFSHLKNINLEWNKIHFFMIDERQVPITSKSSNFNIGKKSFLNYLIKNKKIDKEHLHPYNYKKPLNVYENELKAHKAKFDIAILSSGEDAHVAALFPNHNSIKSNENYFIKFDNSPKPPKKRMSATRKLLEKSQVALLLFFGDNKKQAYESFKNKKLPLTKVPAKLVNKIKKVYVFRDG